MGMPSWEDYDVTDESMLNEDQQESLSIRCLLWGTQKTIANFVEYSGEKPPPAERFDFLIDRLVRLRERSIAVRSRLGYPPRTPSSPQDPE